MYRSKIIIAVLLCVFTTVKGNYLDDQIVSAVYETVDTTSRSTFVSPVSNVILVDSINTVYCSSFEIAWQSLRDNVFKQPIVLDKNFQWVNVLNEKSVTKSLGKEYYSAFSGFGKDQIAKKFREDLRKRFDFDYKLGPFSPFGICAFSFIKKKIDFYSDLYSIESRNLIFNDKSKVKFFGLNGGWPNPKYNEKIRIHDYNNTDDFIVQIVAENDIDEVYFAKVRPEETLHDTYINVMNRVSVDKVTFLGEKDQLGIPYLKFRVNKEFNEIRAAKILNKGFDKFHFEKALQVIDFDLDEGGVSVESVVELDAVFGIPKKFEPRVLNFDEAFLIILKEKGTTDPYFLMWVGNTEFMEKK
jgi:hypothetical protein